MGTSPDKSGKPNIFRLLKSYAGIITVLLLFTLFGNALNLVLPKIIAQGIDNYGKGTLVLKNIILEFGFAALFIFVFTYIQNIIQVYASERVARDIRSRLATKISTQSYVYIQQASPAKLLTNLTSDIDSVKMFVSQAIVSIASSLLIIIGASIMLITINWKLALAILLIIPIIGITFYIVLKKVRVLFKKSREVIDWLNKVINESILGAALIRVVNAQMPEYEKFLTANTNAKNLGLSILKLFATLIPIITFVANMATLTVLALGGHFVIEGSMTLGDFAAFNSYIAILIFPIIIIGFMSNVITQASVSYQRIHAVMEAPESSTDGPIKRTLQGNIDVNNISLTFQGKPVLKNISFNIKAGSRTAIIGPTAAGKTQLLYVLTGLIKPDKGEIKYDDISIDQYDQQLLLSQIGFVFQDSIIFNVSLRENIAFNQTVSDEFLAKAIETAELKDFVNTLPEKLDTEVSERGASLSGGQKQRITLARALSVNPRILLLDDFTARVDTSTEQKILEQVRQNYAGLTLLSVTQKISSVTDYDQIILLMEGEIIATGTHAALMQYCPEYIQIYQSQRSTSHYELQSESA